MYNSSIYRTVCSPPQFKFPSISSYSSFTLFYLLQTTFPWVNTILLSVAMSFCVRFFWIPSPFSPSPGALVSRGCNTNRVISRFIAPHLTGLHRYCVFTNESKTHRQQKDCDSLCCSSLELNPQYLWDMPANRGPWIHTQAGQVLWNFCDSYDIKWVNTICCPQPTMTDDSQVLVVIREGKCTPVEEPHNQHDLAFLMPWAKIFWY